MPESPPKSISPPSPSPVNAVKLSLYEELRAQRRYLEIICERANQEIETRFKNKTREIVRGGIATVLGFLFAWYLQGREQMKANVIEWLAFGVCLGFSLWFIEMLWDCIRAPRLVNQDLVNENERLAAEHKKLTELRSPRLRITYEPEKGEPFVETDLHDATRTLHRVAVTSSVPVKDVVLRANGVKLEGVTRSRVHLHKMHDDSRKTKRVQLYTDEPDYWDIVFHNPSFDQTRLEHIENFSQTLAPLKQEFEIVASGGDSMSTSQIVSIEVDENKKLTFEVRDPTPALN